MSHRSAGKDGKLKQWDANKFHRVQTLEGHTDHVDAIALSQDGRFLVEIFIKNWKFQFFGFFFQISSARDKSVRLWELSDELIVLQEEEEREREKEYEQRLIEQEDIVGKGTLKIGKNDRIRQNSMKIKWKLVKIQL